MKQILQHLRTGQLEIAEVPAPQPGRGEVLIRSRCSLISPGTERMLVEFSQANLLQKARQQPERVKQVLDKMRTDGILPTLEAVFRKLDEPLPLGYCNAGIVEAVGSGVTRLSVGDRVASNAPHAEFACVPQNLCAKIPDSVSFEAGAFTVLGSIALQGVRLAQPTLGERFVVFGMGVLGILTVQLLRASGCDVLAVDLDDERLQLASRFGADVCHPGRDGAPQQPAMGWTNGRGVDGVIITAAAKNDSIVHQAAESCRKRGRIILVGVVDLSLRRSDFYEKELTFQVSCSYGPGRYDPDYEQGGHDYPLGYVRWTEQRNFEAILGQLASGALQTSDLLSERVPISQASRAYELIQERKDVLGVLLTYDESARPEATITFSTATKTVAGEPVVGIIGAGAFATSTLLPALSTTKARLLSIASKTGAHAAQAARKFGFHTSTTDYDSILANPDVDAVFILTRHNQHADLTIRALDAGKHVFVEKPIALASAEYQQVRAAMDRNPSLQVIVGFNRRFSSHTMAAKNALSGRSEPASITMTVNAGVIPPDHWTQNPDIGGGRIIGEACHFIDLLLHLVDSPIKSVYAASVGTGPQPLEDKATILLTFVDGSIGNVNYFANGSKAFPKEKITIFWQERVVEIDNFRVTRGFGVPGFRTVKGRRQDKGHAQLYRRFIESLANSSASPVISRAHLDSGALATFAACESLKTHAVVTL